MFMPPFSIVGYTIDLYIEQATELSDAYADEISQECPKYLMKEYIARYRIGSDLRTQMALI